MLKNKYGEIIFKKDTILYQNENNNILKNKIIYLSFNKSKNYFKLKKDIKLLFFIKEIKDINIYSDFSYLTNNIFTSSFEMHKASNKTNIFIINQLKNENFDGIFSSLNNNNEIEIGIINNINLYEVINDDEICTKKNNVILNIPKKFKKQIEKYKKNETLSKFISNYVFQIMLDNAEITYF